MIFIREADSIAYLMKEETILPLIKDKKFKVADSELSYRQINRLSNNGLLNGSRKSGEWRKFNLMELVYLKIIAELRAYGFEGGKMNQLWDCFFREPETETSKTAKIAINRGVGEEVVGLTLSRIQISLIIGKDGSVNFCDDLFYGYVTRGLASYVTVNITEIVFQILRQVAPKFTEGGYKDLMSSILSNVLTDKERETLKLIRDEKNESVEVIKKDGGKLLYRCKKKDDSGNNIGDEDMVRLIQSCDFQNISISRRDGKNFLISREEVIKPKS